MEQPLHSCFGYSCSQKFLASRAMLPQCRTMIPAAVLRILHHIQMISYYKINMSLNSPSIYISIYISIYLCITIYLDIYISRYNYIYISIYLNIYILKTRSFDPLVHNNQRFKIPRKSLSMDSIYSIFNASCLSAGLLCSMGTGIT